MRRILSALAAAASTAILMTPASAWALDASTLNGRWDGSYSCGEKDTFLSLELSGDGDGKVTGSFLFHPFGEESGPEGSWLVAGEINQAGLMDLRGAGWIDQPEGFLMFDLSGVVQEDGVYPGTIDDAACTSFYVKKKSAP